MTVRLSVELRDAQADRLMPVAGAQPRLQVRSGPQPASCAEPAAGDLLAELILPADWLTAASNGSVSQLGTWSGVAVASGAPGHFRILSNDGATCHMQGDIPADLAVTPGLFTEAQAVTAAAFTYTRGNA